jgi:hypothetical protein
MKLLSRNFVVARKISYHVIQKESFYSLEILPRLKKIPSGRQSVTYISLGVITENA